MEEKSGRDATMTPIMTSMTTNRLIEKTAEKRWVIGEYLSWPEMSSFESRP
jgi:hypothetical protein